MKENKKAIKRRKKKIGYLGCPGTFSHEAAHKRGGRNAELVGYPTFSDLIATLVNGEVDEVMMPTENLVEGVIGRSLDPIIEANGNLVARGELVLPVHLHLVALKDMAISKVKKVVSIPEATGQCGKWLRKNIAQASREYSTDTATALKDLKNYGDGAAAICSSFAAKLYGGTILARDIQDVKDNATHFLILGRSEVKRKPKKEHKTSLIFATHNKAGMLADVIIVFKVLKINMTQIHSRPGKKKLGECIFWIDIDGHKNDAKIRVALEEIEKDTKFFKVLGSYPKC